MPSPFIIVEWEGGTVERVSLWRWLEFLWTHPVDVLHDHPLPRPPGQPKCAIGIQFCPARILVYDFIIPRTKARVSPWRTIPAEKAQSNADI